MPTTSRTQLRKLLLIAVAVASVLILAAGLSRVQFLPARPFPLAGILEALTAGSMQVPGGIALPAGVVQVIAGCLWLLFFVSIIAFIISPEVRKGVLRRVIVYLSWFLLLYSVLSVLQSNLQRFQVAPQGPSDALSSDLGDPAEFMPIPPDFIVDPPQWLVIVVTITLVAVPLGLTWLVWHFLAGPKKESTALEQLTMEAQQALNELQAGADLKDTVMRCYFEMSQILSSQHNLQRAEGMTVREFEAYLAESGLRDEHIRQLTRLFEQVRYGQSPASKQEEAAAVAFLSAIARGYGQPQS